MKKILLFTLVMLVMASPAAAASSVLPQVVEACEAAFNHAGDKAMGKIGFEESSAKPQNNFGDALYEKKSADDKTVQVTIGEKFGNKLCEIYFPEGTQKDFQALREALNKAYGGAGTIYDHPVKGKPYLGQIWADKDTVDGGTVADMKLGSMKIETLFIQYSAVGFQQTQGRTGLIIEVCDR